MTRFLPAWIFSIPVPAYGSQATRLSLRANPFGFQTDIPGVEEDWTGREKVARGLRWSFGAEKGTRVAPCRATCDGPARGPTYHNPIFTPRIFSGVGMQNEVARTELF